jgi:hypothetical protein
MSSFYRTDRLSAQKLVGRTKSTKVNESKMLDRRFAIAPMMDWTGASQKVKRDQRLGTVVASHAVPNAAPSN